MGLDHETLSEERNGMAKMLEWILEHRKQFFYAICIGVLSVYCLFSIGKRFFGSSSDYGKVDSAYSAWAQGEKHDPALFKDVKDPLSRHPELTAKFGTLIAQRMLTLGETKLAQDYALSALKRTKSLLSPYHAQFSQNTLLISQEKFADALAAAYQLKNAMGTDEQLWANKGPNMRSGRSLYAYNLLRIASLEREAGSKEGELKAWEELMQSAGWGGYTPHPKTYDPQSYQVLSENFKSGDVSLFEFIQQRKKLI